MTFLPAFRSCLQAGAYGVMCSYNAINGVPACANKKLLTGHIHNFHYHPIKTQNDNDFKYVF